MEALSSGTSSQSATVHVGVGSFHFQATDSSSVEFSGADYLQWVKNTLGEIAAVGSIDITTHDPVYEHQTWRKPRNVPRYSETAEPFPTTEFVEVSFTLHVPSRVQKEFVDRGLTMNEDLGENFMVAIRDGWQMTNATVWCIDSPTPYDASDAVVVVREVLEREFARLSDPPITFEALGPSPAHFTALLLPGDTEQTETFVEDGRRRNGYHRYRYLYRDQFEDPGDLVRAFQLDINPEIDLLYRIVRASLRQRAVWDEIQTDVGEILDAYSAPGPRGAFKRLAQGRSINNALIALAELELGQRQSLETLQGDFDASYEQGEDGLIKCPVEDQLRRFRLVPVDPMIGLLELFDSGRRTGRGVAIAAVSSVIGAAVAAIATLIAA